MAREVQLTLFIIISALFNFYYCDDDTGSLWHSYQFDTAYANREELIITDVVTDDNFTFNQEVTCWKSLSTNGKIYAVGVLSNGVIILNGELAPDHKGFAIRKKVTHFNWYVTNLELFEHWNMETRKLEIILILSTLSENTPDLHWYKINDTDLDHFWTWHLHKNVTHMRFFLEEDIKYRLVILNKAEHSSLDLYEFDLNPSRRDFWLSQTLSLSSPADSLALNFYGSNIYLSLPQHDQNEVRVYKLFQNRFSFYTSIHSNNITHINSFKIGFKSFLTIGGENSGIYKFTKDAIESEFAPGINLENVHFWFPIPVKTYRDEVALIMQRTVDHDLHQSLTLDVLLYDGQKFVMHDEISCSFYGERVHGLDCMADEDEHFGLLGAAVLSLKDVVGVLVPHKENTALFMIHKVLKTLKNPIELEIEKLVATRKQLQKMITEQIAQVELIKKRIEKPALNDPIDKSKPARTFQEKINKTIPLVDNLKVDAKELRSTMDTIRSTFDETRNLFSKAVFLNKTENRFDRLILKGELVILGECKFENVQTDLLNNETVESILKDLVNKKNPERVVGHKTFKNLEVENISFETANGVDAKDITYKTDQLITVNGNVVFEKPVKVSGDVSTTGGSINDLDLINEVVEMSKNYEEPLQFEHVRVSQKLNTAHANSMPIQKSFADIVGDSYRNLETIDMESVEMLGDITVENVNGDNFNKFIESLCLTSVETHIPGDTVIAGDLNVLTSADIQFLNGLRFPEDYVLRNSEYVTISGQKNFLNSLFANQLILQGYVNDIKPESMITLSTNQSLPGTYMFHDLEVTEAINVDGEIQGTYIDKLLPNPILVESSVIDAKVIMKILEVDGTITVANNFNGQNFEELLKDIVYVDESSADINSVKNFSKGFLAVNGITTSSGTINEIPVSSFITTDTTQTMTLQTLNGPVVFENLLLTGLYGNINITKLEQETVKLSGDQFISSTLVFSNDEDNIVDLSATELEILDTLNDRSSNDYYYNVHGSKNLKLQSLNIDRIQARNVIIEGNLEGSLDNFSLKDFDARRLSATRKQEVSAKYTIKNLQSESFDAKLMNGEPFEKLFDYNYYSDQISDNLFNGKLNIKHLFVNGNLSVSSINGENVKELLKNCVWTDRNNNFNTAVFEGDLVVDELTLNNFNGVDSKLFFENVVYKSETNPVINSFKTFVNGFHVSKMLNSVQLNSIHVDDILTKTGQQHIEGPIIIYGNVVINYDTEVYENLNGVPVSYLSKTYKFEGNTCTVNDDLVFNRLAYINNLVVEGFVNEQHLNDFLQNMVYKSQNSKITGNITFANTVQINQNLIVTKDVNNVDFSEFVQDIIVITTDDTINGAVIFTEPVYVEDELLVDSHLDAKYLNGINLDSWKNNAVFTNRGLIPGKLTFEYATVQGNVYLNYVNELDLKSLIPLRTEQYINQSLQFLEITPFHNISVNNLVNGYVLADEYHNSVLMNRFSHTISSAIIFDGNVLVRNNLDIIGLIAEKNISHVVTTNTEQNLTASYEFNGEVTLDSDLIVTGWINDIDIKKWAERSVKTYSKDPQLISNNWTVTGSVTFEEDVDGVGLLQGMNVRQLADRMEEKRLMKLAAESGIMEDYSNMCRDVNAIMSIAETQIYLFKYFEYLQIFKFGYAIENVHYFKADAQDYILISEKYTCSSHLLTWFNTRFQEISLIKTGTISQVITVQDDDLVFLVIKGSEYVTDCRYLGTNVWKYQHQELVPIYKLENCKLLQESLIPGTFYALTEEFVVEYRLVTTGETNVKIYRKWKISEDNLTFVPRGLGTGIALTNGYKLFKLIRDDTAIEADYGYETDAFVRGGIVEVDNHFLPGSNGGGTVVLNVGINNLRRSLVGVASHEDTSVKGKLDIIKIYEDISTGKVFDKVPTYKPGSLISLEFGNNGETLLIFLEDEQILQIYEYKGVEGFKQRTSVNIKGSKLISMVLSTSAHKKNIPKYILGVVNEKELTLYYAVMSGNQMSLNRPHCHV